jgi:tRNA dimethylallyltransferase
MKKNKIIVILGPTSSGKSEVAIKLAQKFNGEIISADSRQIYRGMDIGTGKVEPDLSGEIPQKFSRGKFYAGSPYMSGGIAHYLIDIANPKTEYNAANFKNDANKIIEDILKRKKLPIICGGTGFWIKAIVDNVNFPKVKPDKELRKILEKKNAEELFKTLRELDSERANNIDAKNKVRLIRAIEICKAIGKVPKIIIQNERYYFLQIGINTPKEELHKKIKKRLEKRFEAGMIEEVKELRRQKLSWKKIQSFGLGYYWIPLYLKEQFGKKDLFEKVLGAEKDYAKRQMTWFRKDKRIIWLKKYKEIEKEVKEFVL